MESNKLQRTFKFHVKVRTGCLTCKKRKLKCDEAKPHCRRCSSTGRACEGYHPDRQSPPAAGTAIHASHSGLFTSTAERRSFFYFQFQACKPLGGYSNSSFWGREVMQAAIHHPPVRHLVIALGAAYEAFETGTPSQEPHFTLQQCNHSIRQLAMLNQTPGSPLSAEATCCLLTASVLFIYLASIRGHFAEAFQHVQSATKVLQDFERSVQKRDGTATPMYPVPVSHLRSLLTSTYGQLRALVHAPPAPGFPDLLVSDLKPATLFTSVQEAHSYVESLSHNTLAFLQDTELHPQPTAEWLEAAVAYHRELCNALESSQNALDVLVEGLPEAGDTQAQEGVTVLRIYHLYLVIRLRIDIFRPDKRESAFDDLEPHLEEILRHCEIVVRGDQAIEKAPRQPSCSSGLGYVMPLHMVAARCRNPRVRRRAAQLLLDCSRRDGLWDSWLAGRIVSQTMEIEEQAMNLSLEEDETVLADRRIREVGLELKGEKTAVLRFVTVDDWKQGRTGTERMIEW
ncbi:hypothetical protein C8A00DRAFT_35645 [Chaetomidium leptoderma]|uniref:Zn(2)-C6 fungal-type domain-containing protein n=1 Tax=Chaetomidium leptoderma TaxID=669021 RepID=A0AAN6VI34_9PEZI|nr:hypothetical protein C8A00DRAFT_35645 [Chaetomidium leptoderma]